MKLNTLLCGLCFFVSISYIPNSFAIDQTKRTLDITTNALGKSLDFTSDTTTSTRNKLKQVQAAKGDAAAYIASNGKIKGPYLTAALKILREHDSNAQYASDSDLAQAILAIQ